MEEEALFALSNGLYVLGAQDKDRYVGSLVDAVSQVAIGPNMIILSCMNSSYTKQTIENTGVFSLSVLSKTVDPIVIANFGFQSSRDVNKWDNVVKEIKDDLPYLQTAMAKIRARVVNKQVFPNNTLFIAEVEDAFELKKGEEPLTYHDYRNGFKEKVIMAFQASKSEEQTAKAETVAAKNETQEQKWVCTVCGYVYDGDVAFEDLPADWVCPLCGVGKELFELRDA